MSQLCSQIFLVVFFACRASLAGIGFGLALGLAVTVGTVDVTEIRGTVAVEVPAQTGDLGGVHIMAHQPRF